MAARSLPERVSALEESVSGIQHLSQEFAAFRIDVNGQFEAFRVDVNGRFDEVNGRFERLEQRLRDESDILHSRMRALHEDLIARIKTLGEGRGAGTTASPRPRRPKRKR